MSSPRLTNKIALFLVASATALLATYLFWSFSSEIKALLEQRMGATPSPSAGTIVNVVKLFLVGIIAYLFVRALNFFFFALAFRDGAILVHGPLAAGHRSHDCTGGGSLRNRAAGHHAHQGSRATAPGGEVARRRSAKNCAAQTRI